MGNTYTSRNEPAPPFEFDMDPGAEFSEHYVCDGGISMLDLSELAALADTEARTPEGVAAIAAVFKGAMGPATYARFKRYTRAHNTDPEVMLAILGDIVAHVTEGPTMRPSPSSPGPRIIDGGSVDIAWPGLAPEPGALTADQIERIRAIQNEQAGSR